MLEREEQLENQPVIKDIYEKYLDKLEALISHLQISSKELPGHIKARRNGLHMYDDTY